MEASEHASADWEHKVHGSTHVMPDAYDVPVHHAAVIMTRRAYHEGRVAKSYSWTANINSADCPSMNQASCFS
jgi:hypothetical protein